MKNETQANALNENKKRPQAKPKADSPVLKDVQTAKPKERPKNNKRVEETEDGRIIVSTSTLADIMHRQILLVLGSGRAAQKKREVGTILRLLSAGVGVRLAYKAALIRWRKSLRLIQG